VSLRLAARDVKLYVVKTTVGQERSVASILESRFHGVFLDFVEEPDGYYDVKESNKIAVVFTSPKTTKLERISVYVAKIDDPNEPLKVRVYRYGDENWFSENHIAEGRYDPLTLKTEGWIEIVLAEPAPLRRGEQYVFMLSVPEKVVGGFRLFYKNIRKDDYKVLVDTGGGWVEASFTPLFKLAEKPAVASVLILPALKGYIFVESERKELVAEVVQNIRHVKARPPMPVSFETIAPHLVEKPLIDMLETGQIVEIVSGPLKGITGKVIRVEKSRREVTLELREAAFTLPITVSIDAVRPISQT